jgi:hypothetical protein
LSHYQFDNGYQTPLHRSETIWTHLIPQTGRPQN